MIKAGAVPDDILKSNPNIAISRRVFNGAKLKSSKTFLFDLPICSKQKKNLVNRPMVVIQMDLHGTMLALHLPEMIKYVIYITESDFSNRGIFASVAKCANANQLRPRNDVRLRPFLAWCRHVRLRF